MDQLVRKQDWVRITDQDVRRYAEITQDFNPLHLDEDFARQTTFGRRIIHGTLGVRVLLEVLEAHCGGKPLDMDFRFRRPIRVGGAVRLVLGETTEAGDTPFWIECEDGEQAIVGSFRQAEK